MRFIEGALLLQTFPVLRVCYNGKGRLVMGSKGRKNVKKPKQEKEKKKK